MGWILTRGEYRFWLIYEAYEVKKKGEKFMMSFTSPEKQNCFFVFMKS